MNSLDTRFPVDVEIEEPILQGKTVFSERGWPETYPQGREGLCICLKGRNDNPKGGALDG
jgi:hypothetical protein